MSVQAVINLKTNGVFTSERKLQFKQTGRPRPILKLIQTTKDKGKEVNRYFKTSMYGLCNWICGCDKTDAFFCFPCLLFGGDSLWTKTGVKSIKHLKQKIKIHSESIEHLNSSVSFAYLGRADIKTQINSGYHTSLRQINEQISKNRYILNKLIDCVKFCGILELLGHVESETSEDSSAFHRFINLVSELDGVFKNHIENSSAIKGISETIQNELLDSMLVVIHKAIIDEIERANFLSIIVDETTDSSNNTQMILLVRYVFNGKIHERLWKLINSPGHTTEELTNTILEELVVLKIDKKPEKLIAQSYGGVVVSNARLGGVQAKVKQTYPKANFVHCYAHQLDSILEKTASRHRQIKVFFANLHAFDSFFSKSPGRTAVLDKFVKVRTSEAAPTQWCFNTRCVETVYTYKIDLINCLETITNVEQEDNNINQAGALLTYLRDENFEYWLSFFHLITPHVDVLSDQLQKRAIDALSIKTFVADFNKSIQQVRNGNLDQSALSSTASSASKCRKRGADNTNMKRSIAVEVCDTILSEVRHRFGYTDHLIFAQLFQKENFTVYREKFPENILQIVRKTQSNVDIAKLKSELEVIYGREDFQNSSGALAILQLFLNMNLTETFSESVKLLEIICTIPMATMEGERRFSTLERINAFLRNTTSQSRSTSLAMLSVERSFVVSIENFNEQVIDHFANRKERRLDFKFKQWTDENSDLQAASDRNNTVESKVNDEESLCTKSDDFEMKPAEAEQETNMFITTEELHIKSEDNEQESTTS